MTLKEKFENGHLEDDIDHKLGVKVAEVIYGAIWIRGKLYWDVSEIMKGDTK